MPHPHDHDHDHSGHGGGCQGHGCGGGHGQNAHAHGGCNSGPEGRCVCMRCGHGQAHAPGRPCRLDRCPQCGAALLLEGSHHHQKALARLAAQAKPEG